MVREAHHEMETVQCATHPEVQTSLRCGRCDKPICPRCLVQTPVGARCQDCARPRRLPTFEVSLAQYARAGGSGVLSSLILGALWAFIPLGGFLALAISAGVGYGIGEAISLSVNRKRGVGLQIIGGAAVFGAYLVSFVLPRLLFRLSITGGFSLIGVSGLVWGAVVGTLVNPFAWLIIGLGVWVAVSRLG